MKLKQYIEQEGCGAVTKMALGIGVSHTSISLWAQGKRLVTPARCVDIERYTKGVVTRRDLRPKDYRQFWPEL